ncbi:unnamed protein product [Darwinula stevensoni]|uniref:Uncharacterized protein n=1 Tax=Darwinula stevensoni TaxID=69355 RepID=A0A7R9A782_9CRUS|nr:unnamed protein product [Darwinula stevensoni]CAG0892060.1 unnamed protein product [Darwinula stevensoni]
MHTVIWILAATTALLLPGEAGGGHIMGSYQRRGSARGLGTVRNFAKLRHRTHRFLQKQIVP